MLNDPSTKDTFAGSDGVRYIEVKCSIVFEAQLECVSHSLRLSEI